MSARVCSWVLEHYRGPSPRKFVLYLIADAASEAGIADQDSNPILASKSCLTVRQVQRHLLALEREGRLTRELRHDGGGASCANAYRIVGVPPYPRTASRHHHGGVNGQGEVRCARHDMAKIDHTIDQWQSCIREEAVRVPL